MAGALAFLDAALLAGLASLAIPALIHLISKRRARRVRFAPLELLLRSQRRTARSVRLRQLVLLLLRTLLLASVALAVARPLLREDRVAGAAATPLVVMLVVDVSASMRALVDGRSVFQRAQRLALDAVGAQPADVRVGAVACGDVPRDLAAPDFERVGITSAVSALKPTFAHADLRACVARAATLAHGVPGDGERRVVVLSDLAAHGFARPDGAAGITGDGGTADGHGVVVEWTSAAPDDAPPNHALTRVDVQRSASRSGDVLEVSFTARRFGGPPVDVPVDLVVGGTRTARLSLPLQGGASVDRTFHHVLTPKDVGGGQAVTVALGDDALAADNTVELPFTLSAPLPVLVVNGAPQPVPFRDEVFYLESALNDARSGAGRVALEVVGFDRVKASQIAGARVVVLANVRRLDDDVVAALTQHVTAGGGLLITAGDQVDVDWSNAALAGLLPTRLRGTKGQVLLDDASVAEVLGLTRFRAEHPVLRSIAAAGTEELPGLGRVQTHTFMLLEPDGETPRDVLARFSNDAPALLERSVGDGRVLLLATSVDRDWSDLAIRPGFLPLARQSVLYLGGALDASGPRILRVGEPRTLRVPRGVEVIEVEPPTGPRQALRPEPGARAVTFRATDVPGLYRVWTRAQSGDARERPDDRFTVLIDPAESDLTRASPALLESSAPQGALSRRSEERESDTPLWPWLLVAAVALFALEAWVLRRSAGAS